MECLMAFCVYLAGGLGIQSGYEFAEEGHYSATKTATNEYGMLVGQLSLIAEYELFHIEQDYTLQVSGLIEFLHASGINTSESDVGLNAAMGGVKLSYNRLYVKAAAGIQVQVSEEARTNNYGSTIGQLSAGVNFGDGMFVQGSIIDGMSFGIIGMSSHF